MQCKILQRLYNLFSFIYQSYPFNSSLSEINRKIPLKDSFETYVYVTVTQMWTQRIYRSCVLLNGGEVGFYGIFFLAAVLPFFL